MKTLSALRASPPLPAAGARRRRPGSSRRTSGEATAADAPFGQMMAEVAGSLASLSAAGRAAATSPDHTTRPGLPAVAGDDEQAAEAAVIAALCDAERRGAPQGGR